MKKVLLFLLVCAIAACTTPTSSISGPEADVKLRDSVLNTMKARGATDVDVTVTRLKELEDPKGFFYYKVNISVPDKNVSEDQYFFYNGSYLTNDFVDAVTGASLGTDFAFEMVKTELDVTPFTVMEGTPGAKNVIVKITDFECPYCRNAYNYLQQKLAERDDYVMYIVHMPLRIHPNAVPMARIFEAGAMMGENFSHELFTNNDLIKMSEQELVERFSGQSYNAEEFIANYNSPEVAAKLDTSMKLATELKVNATPIIYINGKKVEGYNTYLIDKAIAEF
jgi:glutaredoxin